MGGELVAIAVAEVVRSSPLVGTSVDGGHAALERVDSAMRERLADYRGWEVDALGRHRVFLFRAPSDAVSFAVAVQRSVGDRDLGIGVHVGEVSGSLDDPAGDAVTAAVRIAQEARGGEVLVSDVVRQLVDTTAGVSFADRGRVRRASSSDRPRLFAAAGVGADDRPQVPIVGRPGELRLLDELLDGAATGVPETLVVIGEGGIGKTHLARVAASRALARGFAVVTGGAELADLERPGRVLVGWADALSVAVDPRVLDGNAPGSGFTLLESVAAAVEDEAASRPVLVIAEDVQWADELSLRGVAALIRRVGTLPVAVIITSRPTPRPPLLQHIVDAVSRTTGGHVLHLGGLDRAAVASLAALHAGGAPGAGLLDRLAGASGNPMLISELVRSLDEAGHLRHRDGVVDVESGDLPARLRDTVVRRLEAMAPTAVHLLRLASLFGRSFSVTDLAAVAGSSVIDVAAPLQGAVDAGLIDGDGHHLSFRHDLLREAVYEEIPAAMRRDLHLAAGLALAAADASPLDVARHLALGARPDDDIAVEWIERAAVATTAMDVSAAAALFRQALALTRHGSPAWRRVSIRALETLASAGDLEEAVAAANELLDQRLEPADELSVRAALVAIAAASGDLRAAADGAAAAIRIPTVTPVETATLRCFAASMRFLSGDPDGDPRQAAALAFALVDDDRAGVTESTCAAHQTAAIVEAAEGRWESALEHARSGRRTMLAHGVAARGWLIPQVWEGTILFALDRWDDAVEAWHEAQRRAERRGEVALLVQTHTMRALVAFLAARWDDSLSELEAATNVAEEHGARAHDIGISALLAWRAHAMGDRDAAESALTSGAAAWSTGRHVMGLDALAFVQSRIASDDGDRAAALDLMTRAWDRSRHLVALSQFQYFGPELVKLPVAASEGERAAAVVAAIEDIAGRNRVASATAAAARARGLATGDIDALTAAVDAYRASPRRIELAMACEDAGVAVLRAGRARVDVGAALLDEAAEIYLSCGAVAEVARLDAALRSSGVHRRRPRSRTPNAGWDALSPTEARVLELLATGKSNPDIARELYISRRTVETHVSHILRKVGVANRTALAAAASLRHAAPRASVAPLDAVAGTSPDRPAHGRR